MSESLVPSLTLLTLLPPTPATSGTVCTWGRGQAGQRTFPESWREHHTHKGDRLPIPGVCRATKDARPRKPPPPVRATVPAPTLRGAGRQGLPSACRWVHGLGMLPCDLCPARNRSRCLCPLPVPLELPFPAGPAGAHQPRGFPRGDVQEGTALPGGLQASQPGPWHGRGLSLRVHPGPPGPAVCLGAAGPPSLPLSSETPFNWSASQRGILRGRAGEEQGDARLGPPGGTALRVGPPPPRGGWCSALLSWAHAFAGVCGRVWGLRAELRWPRKLLEESARVGQALATCQPGTSITGKRCGALGC